MLVQLINKNMTPIITTFSITLKNDTLSITTLDAYAECLYAACHIFGVMVNVVVLIAEF